MRSIRFVGSSLRRLAGAAVGIAISLPVAAHAGGDAAAGKTLSVACQACHVEATGDTPELFGQRESYITKQLKAFKKGDRKHEVMQALATQLSDDDVANLATFLSSQPAGSDSTTPPEVAAIKKGQMAVPKDFPKGFVLYATVNKPEGAAPTVSKSYINNVGFQAVKAGKPLPDGSAIIVANYAVKLDADKKPTVEKDDSWAVDQIVSYAGMEARPGWGKPIPELLRNANWNYGVFNADKTPKPVNQALCLGCHKPKASTSYVFLLKDIQAKAGAK